MNQNDKRDRAAANAALCVTLAFAIRSKYVEKNVTIPHTRAWGIFLEHIILLYGTRVGRQKSPSDFAKCRLSYVNRIVDELG